jgi:diguanylate cyclase (GGDEF)-like protein
VRSPLLVALVAALVAAAAVLAGAAFGPIACLFALPAALAGLALRARWLEREAALRRLAAVDPLTGLGNGRLLTERLAYEVARHRRSRRRFAVLALDLDGFKRVNDRFGHLAGDDVLREVAQAIERTTREQDTVVRQGGDEFCVLAPETDHAQAEHLAFRVREAVRTAVGGLEGMGVSVGFAVFPDDGVLPDALLEHADLAQTDAKRRVHAQRPRRAA